MQNSCANSDPTWGEHLRHWRRGPKQQAGRHQHLQFCVWKSHPSPFPFCFGTHLNQTCSLPCNLFSSLLSCFQVSLFHFQMFGFAVWFWKVFYDLYFSYEMPWILFKLLLTEWLSMIFHTPLHGCVSLKTNKQKSKQQQQQKIHGGLQTIIHMYPEEKKQTEQLRRRRKLWLFLTFPSSIL